MNAITAKRAAKATLLITLTLGITTLSQAAPQLRIGTLAPKNSTYHRQLIEVGEAWKALSGEGARYMVYPDGGQGGEADMARRLRIGQLQGALLSVVGLREIEPSVAALQTLPLAFRSWEEVDYVRDKMRPAIEKRFLDKGFVVLGWGDGGWVRFFSREPGVRPDDYRKMKFFAWAGESEQQEIMRSLGYTPVPLETADILPSIQTGMITAVPATPYFALASQIYSTANHMLNINWAPIVGALIISKKSWDELSPTAQEKLRFASQNAALVMRTQARKEVNDAVEAMKKRGLTVHTPSPEQFREWTDLAEKLYPKIRGSMVPAATFDEVFMHLKAFRAQQK